MSSAATLRELENIIPRETRQILYGITPYIKPKKYK